LSDWFDELLKDVNFRSKRKHAVDNEVNNDVAKHVKIRIKNLDINNVIIIVTYNYNNGTKTLTLHPQQRLNDFLTQVTTKRDIDVLKYVLKMLKAYVDMNNILKELTTFDLDEYYEKNVKKRRVMLTYSKMNVNNVIAQHDQDNDVKTENNVSYTIHDDDTHNDVSEQQNNNNYEKQNSHSVEQQNDVNERLQRLLRDLMNDLNNVNLKVHNNDELFNAANYVIQRFLTFLINVDNSHDGVINNVINYLRKHINNNGDGE